MVYINLQDNRLKYAFDFLKNKNIKIKEYNFENLSSFNKDDYIIFSPAFKWTLELVNNLPCNITLICGAIKEEFESVINAKNIRHINVMQNKNYVLKNSNLTAEGVLENLICNTNLSIFKQKILILGGGNVANAIGKLFLKLNLNFCFVTKDFNEIGKLKKYKKDILNWNAFKNHIKNFDVIINTIPCEIFNKNDVKLFKNNSIVFEIASQCCLNIQNFKNINYISCPSLPAKYCPKTAGEILAQEILKIIKGEIKK